MATRWQSRAPRNVRSLGWTLHIFGRIFDMAMAVDTSRKKNKQKHDPLSSGLSLGQRLILILEKNTVLCHPNYHQDRHLARSIVLQPAMNEVRHLRGLPPSSPQQPDHLLPLPATTVAHLPWRGRSRPHRRPRTALVSHNRGGS